MLTRPGDSPPVTVGQALSAGLRGEGLRSVLRLWAWLVVFGVFNLASLLLYLDVDLAVAYVRSPFSTLLQGLSWYVAFATALLPMAIVLERRGIARAWQLTHSKLSTAIGIGALLAVDLTIDRLLDRLPGGSAETLGSIVIGIPLTVLMTVAYYVIYAPLSHEDNGAQA